MSGLGQRLLILSAPSGAGKTTLAHRLLSQVANATLSISTTTRAPRGQEQEGRDYHFVTETAFRASIASGDFLEWAEVHGNLYGTRKAAVSDLVAPHWTVFDIDVHGGLALKRQYPGAVTVFVLPPSMSVLEERLRGRQTDDEASIQRRLAASRDEIERGLRFYDYALVNRELEVATAEAISILRAEELRLEACGADLMNAFIGNDLSSNAETVEKKY